VLDKHERDAYYKDVQQRAATIIRFFKLNFGGLAIGTVFYCFSLTPSLLPRPPLYAGVIAGISFAVGYAIGAGGSWIIRRFVHTEFSAKVKRIAWWVMLGLAVIFVISYTVWNAGWENQVRELIGQADELQGPHVFTIISIAFVTAAVIVLTGRLIRKLIQFAAKLAARWVPARLAAGVGLIAVTVLLVLIFNQGLVRAFITVSNRIYHSHNQTTADGVVQPQTTLRSGGPESLVPWKTLGFQGRSFIGSGPDQSELEHLNGRPGLEPIRVYAGLDSAPTVQARADLTVRELERTGAFDRSVLVVATTTGTGWVEPQAADSLEYMWNGDTAIAAMQYSYLPSWISFLVDQQNATEAGQALFNAVYNKWKTLPPETRPKLIAYGLSLGSYGGQSAFSGVEDIQNRTSGALFVGTPSNSQPWERFKAQRDKGSPEWQPVYQGGRVVRFAATSEDLAKPDSSWSSPRLLYLQHASDSVVWWNYNLIWHKPDWLKEKRGPDVSPDMQWYPFITFAQVTVDQFFGTTVPNGHGHNYADTIVAAWRSITQPADWSAEQSQKLQTIIGAYPND